MRYILTFLSLFLAVACNANVLIVVDDILWKDSSVKEAVKTYASDIEKARGVNVKIESFPAAKSGSTPEYLKSVLVKNKDGLKGAIFVDDLPRAQFEYPQWNIDGFRYQRWNSDFFFMDLDGVWKDTASGWFGMSGGKITEKILPSPNFDFGSSSPAPGVPADSFSMKLEGFLKSPQTGLCSLKVIADNARRIFIGDTLVIDAWLPDWDIPYLGAREMQKDSLYAFTMEYEEEYGGSNATLYWKWNGGKWEIVPDDVWFYDVSPLKEGLQATFYGNIGLKEKAEEYSGEPTGWVSGQGNGIYDGHYSKSGEVTDSLEIWVSRIDPYTAGLLGSPKDLLLKWFQKVHASYEKNTNYGKAAYFMVPGTDTTEESNYKFIRGLSAMYGRSALDVIEADSLTYVQSIAKEYDWSIYVGHGDPLGLALGFNAKDVRYPMPVGPRMFHFASCSPLLAYDVVYAQTYSTSVGSAHLFGTTGGGLVSVGATKTSGDNQLDDLMYEYAAEGMWIGEAFRRWLNERMKRNRYYPKEAIYDWFYAEAMIGDPMQTFTNEKLTSLKRNYAKQHKNTKENVRDVMGKVIPQGYTKYKVRFTP